MRDSSSRDRSLVPQNEDENEVSVVSIVETHKERACAPANLPTPDALIGEVEGCQPLLQVFQRHTSAAAENLGLPFRFRPEEVPL